MKLWFWVGQWQENNKWLPTRESAARRTVRSPDSLQKAALINAISSCKRMQGLSFLSSNVCTNTDAHRNLPSIPFIKPGAVSLLGPPAGWQRRRVHQTTGRCTTPRSTPENPKCTILIHGSFYLYVYVSVALIASSEPRLLLWSVITHHNASCLGSVFEHALFACFLKDTGCQHGATRSHFLHC